MTLCTLAILSVLAFVGLCIALVFAAEPDYVAPIKPDCRAKIVRKTMTMDEYKGVCK